jgi:hypothetical protein
MIIYCQIYIYCVLPYTLHAEGLGAGTFLAKYIDAVGIERIKPSA